MTHYFTDVVERRRQRSGYAVCGTVASLDMHSGEPTCETCRQWLSKDTTDEQAIADALTHPVYLGPPVVSTFGDRDITGGGPRERRR